MDLSVAKFGGTSVADAERLEVVRAIIESTDGAIDDKPLDRRYVVLSAPGKRHSTDTKVTDHLKAIAQARFDGTDPKDDAHAVVERYNQMYAGLDTRAMQRDLVQRVQAQLPPDLYAAQLKAFGEEWNARLYAERLTQAGLDATYANPKDFMVLHGDPNNAAVKNIDSGRILELGKEGRKVIVPGFFGYTSSGDRVVFDRGGSDLTGAIVAEAVGANVYENFTDGPVLTADPRIVPDARRIPQLTAREMRELSWGGSSILHHQTLVPFRNAAIPIHVRGTNAFPELGTYVTKTRVNGEDVVGIAYRDDVACFTMGTLGTHDRLGAMADAAKVFKDLGISIAFTSDSVDRISFLVDQKYLRKPGITDRIIAGLDEVLEDPLWSFYGRSEEGVSLKTNLGVVVISGQGIRENTYVGTKASSLLDQVGIEGVISEGNGYDYRRFGGDMCAASLVYVLTNPHREAHSAVRTLHEGLLNY